MADIKFTVAKNKDADFASEVEAAEAQGATIDQKKGIITLADNDTLGSAATVDVSESAYFKTINATGYSGDVEISLNGAVADVVSLGSGNSTVDSSAYTLSDDGKKVTTGADKLYAGEGNDVFIFGKFGGKDNISYYGDGDTIQLAEGTYISDLSFVDKSGAVVITANDSENALAAKNSVLTIDKTKTATNGVIIVDSEGDAIAYGSLPSGVSYAEAKKGGNDTTALLVGSSASGTVESSKIASTIKTINASGATKAIAVVGNANANNITIGSGGGTLYGGNAGTKSTADNLYGTSGNKAVTFYFGTDNSLVGKDTIYNYKSTDNIVVADNSAATYAYKGTDVVITLDKSNTITIKNALGKSVNVNGSQVEEVSDTLPTGLNYDSTKFSKITADDAVITSGGISGYRTIDSIAAYDTDGEPLYKKIQVPVYATIVLGGDVEFNESVKSVDLSASSAPVSVDSTGYDSLTEIKAAKDDSTIVGNAEVIQTFYGGAGTDVFFVNRMPDADADSKTFKATTINNFTNGDQIRLADVDSTNTITCAAKGKDLNISVDGIVVATIKSWDSSTTVAICDESGSTLKSYPKAMPTGLSYGEGKKAGSVDTTSLVANATFSASEIVAEDYGGAAIKTINASVVSASAELNIVGSDAANSLYAPNNTDASVATTLNGGTGNDILVGSSLEGAGQTTYVFATQAKGKKDTIINYKAGDVIVVDTSADESIQISEEGIFYNNGKADVDGFNDTKADVVVSLNKSNTITLKNAAGLKISFATLDEDGGYDEEAVYSFGHAVPEGLAYDAKHTAVTLAADSTYKGDVDLADTSTYYNTIKKVDLTGNSGAANIYGNTIANEFIAGSGGGILDGGSIAELFEENPKLKPTADKITGGAGKDTYVYDAGYGKDSFLSFGSEDVVSLGAEFGKGDLTITDKGNVLTVVLGGEGISTVKSDLNTAANSTFTITKRDSAQSVTFVGEGIGSGGYKYGDTTGVSMDAKFATLTADSGLKAGTVIDVSAINTQPKVIDGRAATAGVVLIGNSNADAIYAGGTADGAGSTVFGGTSGTKAVKDQLYGSDGKDYFLFTAQGGEKGKETDIISNYQAGDVVVLDREPDLVKADGKAITLTWNDTPEGGKATASTLVINGAAQASDMKKFNAIDSSVEVTFAIGEFLDEDGNVTNVANLETVTYKFNNATADSSLKSGKAEWGDPGMINVAEEEESGGEDAQLAAYSWFEEAVATDNVVSSELDSILDVKAITNDTAEQFNADAYFTGIGQSAQAEALTYAARHRAKK